MNAIVAETNIPEFGQRVPSVRFDPINKKFQSILDVVSVVRSGAVVGQSSIDSFLESVTRTNALIDTLCRTPVDFHATEVASKAHSVEMISSPRSYVPSIGFFEDYDVAEVEELQMMSPRLYSSK